MVHDFHIHNNSKLDGDVYSNPDFYLITSKDRKSIYLLPLVKDIIKALKEELVPTSYFILGSDYERSQDGQKLMTKAQVEAMVRHFKVTNASKVAIATLISEGHSQRSSQNRVLNPNISYYLSAEWQTKINNALAAVQNQRKHGAGAPGWFSRGLQALFGHREKDNHAYNR